MVHVHEDLRRAGGLPVGDHRLEGFARAVLDAAVHLAAVVEDELAEGRELHGEGRTVGGDGVVERDGRAVEDMVFHGVISSDFICDLSAFWVRDGSLPVSDSPRVLQAAHVVLQEGLIVVWYNHGHGHSNIKTAWFIFAIAFQKLGVV